MADVMNDTHNCGACQRDCLGAPCSAGACLPTVIASGQNYPRALVVDATFAYWTSGGGLFKAPLGGGTATQLLINGAGGTLAIDSANVYAENLKYAKIGGPSVLGPDPNVQGIAVDATTVYWAADNGTIVSVPIAGGVETVLATGQSTPYGIAVDSNYVYWVTYNGDTVMRVPIGGGTPVQMAGSQDHPIGLALDNGVLYWNAGQYVVRMAAGGGAVTALAQGVQPVSLVTDANYVYWTDDDAFTVSKVDKTGTSLLTLAAGQTLVPWAIAVDAFYVYWTTLGTSPSYTDGMVLRVAK